MRCGGFVCNAMHKFGFWFLSVENIMCMKNLKNDKEMVLRRWEGECCRQWNFDKMGVFV